MLQCLGAAACELLPYYAVNHEAGLIERPWRLEVAVVLVLTAYANPGSWLSIVHVAACGDGHGGLRDHDASPWSSTDIGWIH